MALPHTNTILFNAAGAGLFLFLGGYMVKNIVTTDQLAPCSKRYPAGVQLSLDNERGGPLSPIELQARAGFREYGLLANAAVEKSAGKDWGKALVVNLASTDNEDETSQNGVGYVWPVSGLKTATSACLSYSVLLSKDVDVKTQGHLPGLLAEAPSARFNEDDADGFNARMAWTHSGEVGVEVRKSRNNSFLISSSNSMKWPKQTWVRVEQEVILNEPGKKGGAVRAWIDGNLDVSNEALGLRATSGVKLLGVSGETGYTRGLGKKAAVKISPFVVQWQ